MKKYVGITACPTGIAHTYMAAERLEESAKEAGNQIKVETQGSIGVENELTADDIREADAVVIAADTEVDLSRFDGKRVLVTGVQDGISRPAELLEQALTASTRGAGVELSGEPVAEAGTTSSKDGKESVGHTLYAALMAGVSHMIPFVVCGGIMIALALGIGGKPTAGGVAVPEDSFWQTILQVGTLAFSLMIPVLAGFIAQAIADRPGLVVGMVSGFIANSGAQFPYLTTTGPGGTKTGLNTGFIGAIIIGFIAGYVAKWMRKIPWHEYVRPIVPILIVPIFGTAIVSLLYVYVLGRPLAALFNGLTNFLASMTTSSIAILAIIIGLMISFDMGGPVNKVAFLFAGGMIAVDQGKVMGLAAAAIPVGAMPVGASPSRLWLATSAAPAAMFSSAWGVVTTGARSCSDSRCVTSGIAAPPPTVAIAEICCAATPLLSNVSPMRLSKPSRGSEMSCSNSGRVTRTSERNPGRSTGIAVAVSADSRSLAARHSSRNLASGPTAAVPEVSAALLSETPANT